MGESKGPKVKVIGLAPLEHSMYKHGAYKVASCLNYTFCNSILIFGTHTRSSMNLMKETEVDLKCLTGKKHRYRTGNT